MTRVFSEPYRALDGAPHLVAACVSLFAGAAPVWASRPDTLGACFVAVALAFGLVQLHLAIVSVARLGLSRVRVVCDGPTLRWSTPAGSGGVDLDEVTAVAIEATPIAPLAIRFDLSTGESAKLPHVPRGESGDLIRYVQRRFHGEITLPGAALGGERTADGWAGVHDA